MTELTDRGKAFRSAIAAFIEERREDKLKGKDDPATAAKYEYATWLGDAARRVGQIQIATHTPKATHPDAKGSSLHIPPSSLPQRSEIGSHVLGDDYAEDVVGNAAALDVFKFLKIEVDGRRLLDWMQAGDEDLRTALHLDSATADDWMAQFGSLIRSSQPASHVAAKQLYWLTGSEPGNNAHYQLLQPLVSSSLTHVVHADIQEARFGENNKLARQAFRSKEAHATSYHDYRNLVARKLGGTKPQNVSQLNSERGGINYLLSSLPPPRWDQDRFRNLLNLESSLDRFAYFPGVRQLVKALADFLLSDPEPNMQTRERREAIEQALGQQLPVFAASVRAGTEPGWTRDPACSLDDREKLWLDSERIDLPLREDFKEEDAKFREDYERGDWPDQVAARFANWVNARLHEAGLTSVDDSTYRHWAKQAIVDAAWPVPMQRRAFKGGQA